MQLPLSVPGAVQWLWHIALVVAGFLRFSAFGATYLTLYFVASLVSVRIQAGVRTILVWTALTVALLASLLQLAMQITWAVAPDVVPAWTVGYDVLVMLGIQRVTTPLEGFRVIAPDPLVLIASIAAYWFWLRPVKAMNAGNEPPAVLPVHVEEEQAKAQPGELDAIFSYVYKTPLTRNPEQSRRRERKFWNHMAEFLLVVAAVALSFAVLTAPSILSLPYMVLVLLALWLWTIQLRVPKDVQELVHSGIIAYAIVHLAVVYIFQIPMVNENASVNMTEWLGVFSFYSTGPDWVAPVWSTYMLMPSLLVLIVCIRGFQRAQSSAEALRNANRPRRGDGLRSVLWAPRIRSTDSYLNYTFMLAPPILMAWSITFPNYVTAVFMVWSLFAVLFPTSKTSLVLLHKPLLLIALGDVFVSTLANLYGPDFVSHPYTGWEIFPVPFMSIGGQLLFTLGFCFTVYPMYASKKHLEDAAELERQAHEDDIVVADEQTAAAGAEEPRKRRGGGGGRRRKGRAAEEPAPAPVVDEAAEKRKADWASFVTTMRLVIGLLFVFFLEHLYLVALVVVYFCSLESVNLLNAIFMLFFLSFMLSPKLAQNGWIFLVGYTELVIAIQFIWQFPFSDPVSNSNTIAVLVGLEDYDDDLWTGLALHITILFACWLQLATYDYLEVRKRALQSSLASLSVDAQATTQKANVDQTSEGDSLLVTATKSEEEAQATDSSEKSAAEPKKEKWHVRALWTVRFLYELLGAAITENFIIICFMQFLVIAFTGKPKIIELMYLVFFFICLVLYQLHLPRAVVWMWPLVVFASASFLSVCYLYQFQDIYNWLTGIVPASTLEDIGLIWSPGTQLFLYLLQHVAIFISTGYQMVLFVSTNNYRSLWGEAGYINTSFPKVLRTSILVVQRLVIIAAPRTVLSLLFFAAINQVNVINGIFLVLLAFYAPWRQIQRWTRLIVLLYAQVVIYSRLIFQLGIIQDEITDEDRSTYAYVGFNQQPVPNTGDIHVASFYLLREIFLVFMIAISTASLDWRRHICEETGESMIQEADGSLVYDPDGTFLLFFTTSVSAKDNVTTTTLKRGLSTRSNGMATSSETAAAAGAAAAAASDASPPDETILATAQADDLVGDKEPEEMSARYALKDFLSNLVTYTGYQLSQLMHVITALVHLNTIGIFYLFTLGFTLVLPKRFIARAWWVYLGVVAAVLCWQYFIFLGLPPNASAVLPWETLDPDLLTVLGMNAADSRYLLIADFVLLFFCVLQRDVFYREKAKATRLGLAHDHGARHDDSFIDPALFDFSKAPRSLLSEIKLTYFRYFFRIVVILTFVGGTSSVSVLSFLYLLLSMYMLSQGEDVLLNKNIRTRVWFVYRWYNYMWFLIVVAFQLYAYLYDYSGNQLLSVIGLNRLVLKEEDLVPNTYDQLAFSKQRIIGLLAFAAMLVQQAIYDSPYFPILTRFLNEEVNEAATRRAAYKSKQDREQDAKKQEILANFARSKAKYDRMIKKFYTRWSGVSFGQTKAADAPVAVATTAATGVTIDETVESSPAAIKQEEATAKLLSALDVDEADLKVEIDDDTPFIKDDVEDENEVKEHGKWMNRVDVLIRRIFALSADYAVIDDVGTMDDNMLRSDDSWTLRIWLLVFGIYYMLMARVDALVYIFVFVNQIVNGTVLSTILTWSLLLFGIAAHPFTPKTFWSFVIYYTEFVIVLKYFFQFPFHFNDPYTLDPDTACTPDAAFIFNAITMLGIQRYCDKFFSPHIITEMLILVMSFSVRSVLIKFGLWDTASIDEAAEPSEEHDPEAIHSASSKPVSVPVPAQVVVSDSIAGSVNSINSSELQSAPVVFSGSPPVDDDDEGEEDEEAGEQLAQAAAATKPESFDPLSPVKKTRQFVKGFVDRLVGSHEHNLGEDYYTLMFFADVFVFVLTVLFFQDFSTDSSSDLTNILEQNQVPLLFLVIAITEFVVILIDRMIYSAKSIRMKLLVQYATVIGYHVWLFFYLPNEKGSPFLYTGVLPFWYFVKCIYWYYSALQLKSGYLQFNINLFFITKSYGVVNRFLYIGYRQIPFIFEIRCLLDWTVTDTTLTFFRWLKFEDIYASNYDVKTLREDQKRQARQVGDIQNKVSQWCQGFFFAVALVLLLWFPLLLMALPGATIPNPTTLAQFEITINDFDSFYVQSTSPSDIAGLSQPEYDELSQDYKSVFNRLVPLTNYQTISFKQSSRIVWSISPPARANLIADLRNTNISSFVRAYMTFDRESSLYPLADGYFTRNLNTSEAIALADVLEFSNSLNSLVLDGVIPMFLESAATGQIRNLDVNEDPATLMSLRITHTMDNSTNYLAEWFDVVDLDPESSSESILQFIVLSINVPSSSSFGSYGIIGLYVVVVYTVGMMLRVMISNAVSKIMFEDLPSVDRILEMCHDIYVAREFKGFIMEEELYSELIELYRDPQALIEISKPKQKDE